MIVLPFSLHDFYLFSQKKYYSSYKKVDILTPDGMPIVWWLRWKTGRNVKRIYGPDLMKNVLKRTQGKEYRHGFYGSSSTTLKKLEKKVKEFAPKVNIIFTLSPPYRDLTDKEEKKYLQEIKKSNCNILWLGLSSPKQVVLAQRWKKYFSDVDIFCVGAAFDFLSGVKSQAPKWMQQYGLEWLFRLITEPRRLGRRYLINIPLFLYKQVFSKNKLDDAFIINKFCLKREDIII